MFSQLLKIKFYKCLLGYVVNTTVSIGFYYFFLLLELTITKIAVVKFFHVRFSIVIEIFALAVFRIYLRYMHIKQL